MQAPQSPASQPSFVPGNLSDSRKPSASVAKGEASTLHFLPLTVSVTVCTSAGDTLVVVEAMSVVETVTMLAPDLLQHYCAVPAIRAAHDLPSENGSQHLREHRKLERCILPGLTDEALAVFAAAF